MNRLPIAPTSLAGDGWRLSWLARKNNACGVALRARWPSACRGRSCPSPCRSLNSPASQLMNGVGLEVLVVVEVALDEQVGPEAGEVPAELAGRRATRR